jgi:glycosyltransferase involved in cell wall biosynthesis
MMHGYFGACVSGQKAFSFPSIVACTRRCDAGCLAYYLPRRCGQRRPDLMLAQYAWAIRQQKLFPRYARIVVASDHMRREYLRYGIEGDRVHAIPLFAVDGASPSPAAPSIDVLFLGRMTPLKGAAVLIRAAAVAAAMVGRPLTVVLAGEGQSRAALDRLASQFEAKRLLAVECPGWVDGDARSALLARATLIAVPSLWPEPFGLVGLEAAQHGVPAVAFDVGGIREWLEDGVNGRLVEPSGGAAAFGGAIAALVRDGALRGCLAAGARAAASRLSADAHATMLEHVLVAAAHEHACRSAGTS